MVCAPNRTLKLELALGEDRAQRPRGVRGGLRGAGGVNAPAPYGWAVATRPRMQEDPASRWKRVI